MLCLACHTLSQSNAYTTYRVEPENLTKMYAEDDARKAIPTLKCLSIWTSKIINFPFVSNGKLMVFRCSNI